VIEIAPHNSDRYGAAVELRRQILRLPLGLDFSPEELAAEADQVHIVDLDAEKVVACLSLVPNGDSAKMRQVAVAAEWQGKCRGRYLVEFSEVWAKQAGFTEITLHARETAVPFYLALGYRVTGEPFTEVGLPHQAMHKFLNDSIMDS